MTQKPRLSVVRAEPSQDKSSVDRPAAKPVTATPAKGKTRRVKVRRVDKQGTKKGPPAAKYYLVTASLGVLPQCVTCSSLDDVDSKLRKAAAGVLPEDFRAFVFAGEQIEVVDHYGIARLVDPVGGKLVGGGEVAAGEKGSLETGQVFKGEDDLGDDNLLGAAFDDENDNLFSLD